MTTGLLPFRGRVQQSSSKPFWTRRPPLPVRLNPAVPVELERTIDKLLEKDRDLRYQSAAELRADLKRLRRATESGTAVAALVGPQKFSTRKYLIPSAVVLFVAMTAAGIWYWRAKASTSQIESIAVIPFANVGGSADTDYLSDGLTESLISSLAHVPGLKVKSRNSVFRYKGKDVDVQKVGKDLTVDALLTGRVVQHGDSVQVSADLTNVQDNTEIWGEQYERKASDIISLQQQIAGDIADKLRSKLSGAEKQQITKQGTQNPDAYQLYVKGRYYWNKRTTADIKTAISYFNQAIDKDPSYALAYTGLADSYLVLPYFGSDPHDVIPSRMLPPQRLWNSTPRLPVHMRTWLQTSCDSIGTFPPASRSSERPLNLILATPPPISGLAKSSPNWAAGHKNRSMKSTGPISLIRCRPSSAWHKRRPTSTTANLIRRLS